MREGIVVYGGLEGGSLLAVAVCKCCSVEVKVDGFLTEKRMINDVALCDL